MQVPVPGVTGSVKRGQRPGPYRSLADAGWETPVSVSPVKPAGTAFARLRLILAGVAVDSTTITGGVFVDDVILTPED